MVGGACSSRPPVEQRAGGGEVSLVQPNSATGTLDLVQVQLGSLYASERADVVLRSYPAVALFLCGGSHASVPE
jgi:hypothetical protein